MLWVTIEELEGIERDGLIFKLITGLKQVCNHPSHLYKTGNITSELSGKAQKQFPSTKCNGK